MGAHSWFAVGDTWIQMTREHYNPDGAILFRQVDAKVDDKGELDYFQVSSRQMLDRLELLGISIDATAHAFMNTFHEINEEYRPASFDFREWLEAGKESLSLTGSFDYQDHDWIDYVDAPYVIRAIIEIYGPEDVPVVWNLAEVIEWGYVAPNPRLCEKELERIRSSGISSFPVVVLTEGSTDAELLSGALKLIYPHLADFLRFMDFKMGAEGGASTLLRTLKSFVASGIANRVIAVFDNDTAAADTLASLRIALPDNFRILRYPDIDLGRSYPTLGPSGEVSADINGSAGSLELYFGRDILSDSEGKLTPVRWTGHFKRQSAYQGELESKAMLQRAFRQKIKTASRRGYLHESEDWSGMIAILDSLRRAFTS